MGYQGLYTHKVNRILLKSQNLSRPKYTKYVFVRDCSRLDARGFSCLAAPGIREGSSSRKKRGGRRTTHWWTGPLSPGGATGPHPGESVTRGRVEGCARGASFLPGISPGIAHSPEPSLQANDVVEWYLDRIHHTSVSRSRVAGALMRAPGAAYRAAGMPRVSISGEE